MNTTRNDFHKINTTQRKHVANEIILRKISDSTFDSHCQQALADNFNEHFSSVGEKTYNEVKISIDSDDTS